MKLKTKENRDITVSFRVSEKEANKIARQAKLYECSQSDFIRYASLNFVPGKEDLTGDERPKKKKRKTK